MGNQLYVITVQGLDRPGLVAGISEILADANVNIVDIDQTVIRKLFAMFIIADFTSSTQTFKKVREGLIKKARELDMKVSIEPYTLDEGLRRKEERKLILLTIIGKDRPGIVARFSSICAENGVNIERAKMMARGDTIAMELLLNTENLSVDFNDFKDSLHGASLGLGLSAIIQRQDVYRKAKKLVVCDLDSTIIQQEIIDELSAVAGVGEKVESITRRAMEGEMDYTKALKERVRLLKGLPVSVLDEILKNITFSSGVEDLLLVLKELGCKIAIITGSFSYFTDKIKEKFDIDFVFANELIIEDGKLTGEVKEPIIDAEMKRRSIQELIEKEGIKREEVIAIGDGANDRFMLMEAGLGIAFDAKEILRKVADGVIKKDNLGGLIYCLSEFKDY
ncbi:MAG: phosphoserine phosphatase SerB [archaeon]|nr:phosphoserine phosphatase SerB [archaeon]MCP8305996.1 phosphoserine phosphatase SerB [archaeon]